MSSDEDALYRAGFALDALALGQALLSAEFDEARFREHLVATESAEAGYQAIHDASRVVMELLGPAGAVPRAGIGQALLDLGAAINSPGVE